MSRSAPSEEPVVAIAATFTAEPLGPPLRRWLSELGRPHRIEFAQFNQVMQQLVAPDSLLANNAHGLNVLLLRLEDWLPDVERNAADLIRFVGASLHRRATPHLVCLCPPSARVRGDAAVRARVARAEENIAAELAPVAGCKVVSSAQLLAWYPVAEYDDAEAEEIGRIPYTAPWYSALATVIARLLDATLRPPWKVVAVDCDGTLWRGVVGEDGPAGVTVDAPHAELQRFLRAQRDAGMVLCLCSKNDEADVRAVFDGGRMELAASDIVSWKVDWQPKSNNLRALSAELGLGLDSFVFVDDSPIERAQVAAGCPEVLVLALPADPSEWRRFFGHVWAFDRFGATDEDRQRSARYRDHAAREQLRHAAPSFAEFLDGLALEVQIAPPEDGQLGRVAQLIARTNQFNLTTRRRSEAELRALLGGGAECLVVSVRDRFGDYGLVGALLYRSDGDALRVDTFLLSCRVLQRGVEHRMLARLGQLATERGLLAVELEAAATAKNRPAMAFVATVGGALCTATATGVALSLPVAQARACEFRPTSADASAPISDAAERAPADQAAPRPDLRRSHELWARLAGELSAIERLHAFLTVAPAGTASPRGDGPRIEPRDLWEQSLNDIVEEVLGLSGIDVADDLFNSLGADSLGAARMAAEVRRRLGKKIDATTVLQARTIAGLADVLRAGDARFQSSVVALRPGGKKRPFFLAPGAGGSAFQYVGLAQQFDRERPLYAFQDPNLFADRPPFRTTEDMAAYYVGALRQSQPRGPFLLGGWSYGGAIAFEMANQLIGAGEEVAGLVMFDTPRLARFGRWKRTVRRKVMKRMLRLSPRFPWLAKRLGFGNVEKLSPWNRFWGLAWLDGDVDGDVAMVEFAFPGVFERKELEAQPPDRLWEHVFERVQKLDPKYVEPGMDAAATRRAAKLWGIHHQLQDDYVPRAIYPRAITMFALRGNAEPLGWSDFSTVPLGLHQFDIRGTTKIPHAHNAMMQPENVRLFVAELGRCLDVADR